jgi:DNA/RNA endonuclease G (NUC1)
LNRGAWADLEDQVRDLAKRSPVSVLAGPDYDRLIGVLPRADEPHQIPSALWMVVTQNKITTAYYFDQDSDQKIEQAIVTIPELEQRIGLNIP